VIVDKPSDPVVLHAGEPTLEVHRDCIYVPVSGRALWWDDPAWGVYDATGRLIEAAAYYRGPGKRLAGQSPICVADVADVADAPYAPAGRYIYLGNVIDHYGHFLLSSMSRVWALRSHDLRETPLVGHGPGVPDGWFSHSFVRGLYGAAGVVQEDFAVFEQPVRIRELIVPRPSLEEHNFAYAVHAEIAHACGDRLAKTQDLSTVRDMVYISKHALHAHPTGLSNEAALVMAFERAGVPIVHPQYLSLAQQVALFRTTRRIIGQVGSAFHTTILSPPGPDQAFIQLAHAPDHYGSNHALIDLLNGNPSLYVYAAGSWIERPGGVPGLQLADPDATARDLIELARSL
jgi:hypothetical protein